MNNWKETTLGEVAKNVSRRFNFSNKEKVVFVNTGDVQEGKFLHKNYLKIDGLPGQAKKALKKGDILLSEIRPANKRYALVDFETDDYVVSTKFMVICGNALVDPKFLYILLISKQTLQEFQVIAESRSGTFPQITFDSIANFPILLPSLPEQKQIAAVLLSLDDKIELLRKQNETLEKIAQGIFREWFVNFKVDEKKLKLKGGVPEGWRVGKIYETGKIVCGKTPSKENADYFGGKIPFIKIPDMHDQMFLLKTSDKLSKNGADSQKTKTIPKNSICVSCIATVGLVSITTEDSQTNQQINSVVPNNECLVEYLYFSLKSISGFLNSIGSSGTTTANVNTGTFMNLEILIPAEEHLLLFHKNTGAIFSKIKDNNFQIQTLSRLRDTLLPKLMSGEIETK